MCEDGEQSGAETQSPRPASLDGEQRPRRGFGRMKGKIWIADDFDVPLPDDLLDLFENGPIFPGE